MNVKWAEFSALAEGINLACANNFEMVIFRPTVLALSTAFGRIRMISLLLVIRLKRLWVCLIPFLSLKSNVLCDQNTRSRIIVVE